MSETRDLAAKEQIRWWERKALMASLAGLLILCSSVFGLTVKGLSGDTTAVDKRVDGTHKRIENVEKKVERIDERGQGHGERIKTLEANREEDLRRFTAIDNGQNRLERKLDEQGTDIKRILERVK